MVVAAVSVTYIRTTKALSDVSDGSPSRAISMHIPVIISSKDGEEGLSAIFRRRYIKLHSVRIGKPFFCMSGAYPKALGFTAIMTETVQLLQLYQRCHTERSASRPKPAKTWLKRPMYNDTDPELL